MPDRTRINNIVFIVDLSGSMTEGAKLRIVINLIKTILQTAELGLHPGLDFSFRIVYIAEQLEENSIDDSYEIPAPSAFGGTFNDVALADYLTAHNSGQNVFFLFSDMPHDTSSVNSVFTILIGDEVSPDKFSQNAYSAETFPSLWQFVAEGGRGGTLS